MFQQNILSTKHLVDKIFFRQNMLSTKYLVDKIFCRQNIIVSSYHHIIIPSYIRIIMSSYHHTIISPVNSKTSNGLKIARIAPILMILGQNRSRRPNLNFCAVEKVLRDNEKFSQRANEHKVFCSATPPTNRVDGNKMQAVINRRL